MPIRGDRLNKPTYSILRSIDDGNVGDAWVTYHEIFGREVVQKRYSTIGLEDTVAYKEPRLLRDITHAHVAEVLEAQFDPDMARAITFVMPYYEGRSIAYAFDAGFAFSIHRTLKLAMQVLDALAHVHRRHRYIHRDVKPGNVLLNGDRDYVYLGDWGSAAEMNDDGQVAAIHGSPLYRPPEGGPDDGAMGITGDVYGVGSRCTKCSTARFRTRTYRRRWSTNVSPPVSEPFRTLASSTGIHAFQANTARSYGTP